MGAVESVDQKEKPDAQEGTVNAEKTDVTERMDAVENVE